VSRRSATWVSEPPAGVVSTSAKEAGFARFRDGPRWRVYKNPKEVQVGGDADSLKESLFRIERQLKSGGEAAWFLGYEAGYALQPRLHQFLDCTGPLSRFGLYPTCSILSRSPIVEDTTESLVEWPRRLITRNQ